MNHKKPRNMSEDPRYIIELCPPIDPEDVPAYCKKFERLYRYTSIFALSSHSVELISGFDRCYNLAKYMLQQRPGIDILFHITCNDINRVNISSRMILLKELNIRKILVVTGEGYKVPTRLQKLYYLNSTQLGEQISEGFSQWFDSIAIAGYPSNDLIQTAAECNRLCEKLSKVSRTDTIYTQCVLDSAEEYILLDKAIRRELGGKTVKVVPSIAIYDDCSGFLKAWRLIGEPGGEQKESYIRGIFDNIDTKSSGFALEKLSSLCNQIRDLNCMLPIYVCAFNKFDIVEELILRLSELRGS